MGDRSFLFAVYASTRELELAAVEWDVAQKAAFVRMQFDAQHAYYQEHYAGAAFDIILVNGQPAGRLYVSREEDEIRIVDIALLPGTATATSGRHCCADFNQRRRLPAGRCASTSNASIPRSGCPSVWGSRQSPTAEFICSWNGGEATTPNFQLPTPKESRSNHLGESRKNKLVGPNFTKLSKGFPWELEIEVGS